MLALNPIPSRSFAGSEQIAYVAPDAEFSVQQGQLVIELNERILPRLSVNAEYAALMNTSDDPEVQRYVKEKISEAQALIKGVHTRCDTLIQMLTLIGREQHGFFCGGGTAARDDAAAFRKNGRQHLHREPCGAE